MAKANKKTKIRQLAQYLAIHKPLAAYSKKKYAQPLFVFRETLAEFSRHNIMGLSASLSFYTLFALIPLILLIFYMLSHLVFSSDHAIVKLAIITGKILPDFSNKIMIEVYNASKTKAAWGALGLFILLWSITPLAGAMRASFYRISSIVEPPSFLRRKLKDVLSVLGILILFFLFTSSGFVVEKVVHFFATHLQTEQLTILGTVITLILTTTLIALFYKMFFPMHVAAGHLFLGAFLTALLWLLMRPAFSLFLSVHQNFGAVFGSMKNMFVSITWLYLNFAVFLLGSVLISTLRKKDALMVKGLFDDAPNKEHYIEALMLRYGINLKQNEYVFSAGNTEGNFYYLVDGAIALKKMGKTIRTLKAGDYFGEFAKLSQTPTTTDAIVSSKTARIIIIYSKNIDALLVDEPKITRKLLKQMANRLHNDSN